MSHIEMTQYNISTTQLHSSFLVSLNIVLKTLQCKMKAAHHDFIAIFKACGCLENWILLQHCLLQCPLSSRMHALVSIFIKHYLCNPHPFYQSETSVFEAFRISSVLVELCLPPGTPVHIFLQSKPGEACNFPNLWCNSKLKPRSGVDQDAEECGEAGW
jgi:hypothetical protein